MHFTLQDILCKVRTHLVENKKHVRYGDWNAADVRQNTLLFLVGSYQILIFQ